MKAWIGENSLVVIETNSIYIKWLLSDMAHKKFVSGKHLHFALLQKCDRAIDLDSTHFRRARMMNSSTFEVMDLDGMTVAVSASWACQNLEADAMAEATAAPRKWTGPLGIGSAAASTKLCKEVSISHIARDIPTAATNNSMPIVTHKNQAGNQCLGMAMASALHHCGYKLEAKRVALGYRLNGIPHNSNQLRDFKKWVLRVMEMSNVKVRWRNAKHVHLNKKT